MSETNISVINFDENNYDEKTSLHVQQCSIYNQHSGITWIDIDSNKEPEVVNEITQNFHFHPLIKENIQNPHQRPKFEDFDHQIFILFKLISFDKTNEILHTENVSIIFGEKIIVSFQEKVEGDIFDKVRQKIKNKQSKLRKLNADYLVYELLESTIESYYNILETIGETIESLESEVISKSDTSILRRIYRLKRHMMFLRKNIWPMREVLNNLIRTDSNLVNDSSKIYLRSVYEHCTQLLDHIEVNREMLAGLLDIYLSSVSYKMNGVMKVLTIISTIFIPLTFITSIYGMNFEFMPELKWKYGYLIVWIMVIISTVMMLIYFKKKKWF